MRKDIDELWRLIEPPVEGAGLELVEVEWNREPSGWVLRVFIDRPQGPYVPGASNDPLPLFVGHADCERISRELSALLDVSDVIRHTYHLEVSSPGIDRPLRRERDFARFVGQKAKIRTNDPVEGRRNFSGVLIGVQGEGVHIDCDGKTYLIPLAQVVRASLIPDWEAEFQRSKGIRKNGPKSHQPDPQPTPRSAT